MARTWCCLSAWNLETNDSPHGVQYRIEKQRDGDRAHLDSTWASDQAEKNKWERNWMAGWGTMAGTLGEYGSQRCTLIFSEIVCIYAAVIRMSGN